MKLYKGINREPWYKTAGIMQVYVQEGNNIANLDPAPSQKLRNHSPTGFSWGYGGSGPAQLALAILLDYTGDDDFAQQHYQDFKFDVIARLDPEKDWELTEEQLRIWCERVTESK